MDPNSTLKAPYKDILKITYKVEFFATDYNTKKEVVYYSRIEDVHKDSFSVAAPYMKGFYLPRHTNRQYDARIIADSCTYTFKTTLLKYREDPIPLWVVSFPVNIRRVQRRGFVRLDIRLATVLEVVNLDHPEAEPQRILAVTKDVSAGGIGILHDKAIPPGTKLKISLALEQDKTIITEGETVRNIPPEGERVKYIIPIRFTKEDSNEAIAKFIFKKQLEINKKEKGFV